jgi:uncharacterized protein (TIGR02145 family)
MCRKITLQLWLMLVAMPFAFAQSGTLVPSFEENRIMPGAEDASEQVNLQNGLVAYYPFNGNANDESGNGHNGTVNGATLATDRFGNHDRAYFFNGQGNFISVNEFNVPSNTTTITCWVKPLSAVGIQNFFSKHNDSGDVEVLIRSIDNKYAIEWTIGGTYFTLSDYNGQFTIDLNHPRFDLLVLLYDGEQVRFYINNTLIASKNISGQIANNRVPMIFGKYAGNYTGITEYFTGVLDDIRIYNRALNSAELLALYNEEDDHLNTITDIEGNIYKTVVIGTQTWMAENLKTTRYRDGSPIPNVTGNSTWISSKIGAYCWYNNDINYKTPYGALYNWNTISTGNICPTGWHVPSASEWDEITAYLGGMHVAGGKMKTIGTDYWVPTNEGATNETGFSGLPGGQRNEDGTFMGNGNYCTMWVSTTVYQNVCARTLNGGTDLNGGCGSTEGAHSIRCTKDNNIPEVPSVTTTQITNLSQNSVNSGVIINYDGGNEITLRGLCWDTAQNPDITKNKTIDNLGTNSFIINLFNLTPNTVYYVRAYAVNSVGISYGNELSFKTMPKIIYGSNTDVNGTVKDIDGNIYTTVKIGSQTWMAENLKTTRLNDGTLIPLVPEFNDWVGMNSSAYCWYNNDSTNKKLYGALYNYYPVETGKLCPTGWHMPNEDEWIILKSYLGDSAVGGKLKEAGLLHWPSPNKGATNSSGFTALPGRLRSDYGGFIGNDEGAWWSATPLQYWYVTTESDDFFKYGISHKGGVSVRCLNDTSNIIEQFPELTTDTIMLISKCSAVSGGTIGFGGGSPVTAKGICWSTSPNPDTTSSKTMDGSGTGSFISNITGLIPNTIYYVRSYAINNTGVGYGNELNFKTLDDGTINLRKGLVAYYPFNGNANDESGNGHNGTLYNNPQVVTGYIGSGYQFNGNSGIFVDNDISLHPPTFTVSLYFKPSIDFSDTYRASLFQNELCATAKSTGTLFLLKDSRTLNTNTTFNNQYTALSSPNNSVKINEWNHALTIYDGDSLSLYLNGYKVSSVFVDNANIPDNFHNQKIGIGTSSNVLDPYGCGRRFATEFFDGLIDEIRIYNRALNASEIQALGNENNISINSPALCVPRNSIFEIPLNAGNLRATDNVIAYQFDFGFDSQKMQYQEYSIEGTLAESGNVQVKQANNKLSFAWAGQEALYGSGQLIKLRFKAAGTGSFTPAITNFLLNADSVKNISTGNITIFANYGDVDANGNVQAYDAALTLQYSVGLDPLPSIDPLPWENWRITAANVDGQSGITAYDAALILKYTVGLINAFPVQNLIKSTNNPQADVNITLEDGYLVFRSAGELYGLNISVAGNTEFLGTPQIPDPRVLSSINISSGSYSIGLATNNALTNNDILLKIPVNTVSVQPLTIDMIVNQEVKQFSMGLPTTLSESVQKLWEIFPNPANTILFFRNLPDNASVTIYDAQGNVLINRRITNNQVDISSLDNGIYIINIKADKNTMTQKLLKQ